MLYLDFNHTSFFENLFFNFRICENRKSAEQHVGLDRIEICSRIFANISGANLDRTMRFRGFTYWRHSEKSVFDPNMGITNV